MKQYFKKFFDWYEKYTEQNVLIATALFFTQIAHLVWLGLFVIAGRLTGEPLWEPSEFWQTLLIIFDYFEIPALIAATLLYASLIRQGQNVRKAWLYILFVNLQYLHIFWITDEFIVGVFTGAASGTILPAWLAWIAILVDYRELPVIVDTTRRSLKILKSKLDPSAAKPHQK